VPLSEVYGLSETSGPMTWTPFRVKVGTVGPALPGVDVVLDADGEVLTRGGNVFRGYLNAPEQTADVFDADGWFHTGDIGVLDADGYLTIVDRKKDMLIRGGTNVYPREIEEVLMTHPAVSLAGVIGVPDERLGEEVKAFVVLKPGASISADALIAWSKEQLAAYKYPRTIEFRESLPMGATGKVLKRALK